MAFFSLKTKDGERQSPDFPALFDHPHEWLRLSSWTVPVTKKQTRPWALAWDCPACVAAGTLSARLGLMSTHLLPGSAKPCSKDSHRARDYFHSPAIFGRIQEYLHGCEMCQPHILKQRKGSGPYAGTTFGCLAAGEEWSLPKMYCSLVVRGLCFPWEPGSSTHGPFTQAQQFVKMPFD